MAEKPVNWTKVHLKYPDGVEIVQFVDAATFKKIEAGDENVLKNLRESCEESSLQKGTASMDIEDDSSNTDLEDSPLENQPSITWTREATELLINLYEEYEPEMEDPRKKKKEIWRRITEELHRAGYKYAQCKVEGKWRSLLASHKDLTVNKKKTGQKRKTFQYFEKIDNILSKRHDINPPFTSGSDLPNRKETKFCTKGGEDEEKSSSDLENLDGKSARRRKVESRKASDSGMQVIELLKDIEKQRKEEFKERENRREERAKEKNDLFREFLDVIKAKHA